MEALELANDEDEEDGCCLEKDSRIAEENEHEGGLNSAEGADRTCSGNAAFSPSNEGAPTPTKHEPRRCPRSA